MKVFEISTMFLNRRIFPNLHKIGQISHKSSSPKAWMQRHVTDPYVKKSKYDGYRARSAYKLIEIDDKFKILRPGQFVVDCGAAPGSWSQVVGQRVKNGSERIVAVDRSHFSPIDGVVSLVNSDFTDQLTIDKIMQIFDGRKIDLVLSDMAPNASGNSELDHFQIVQLAYSALKFAIRTLEVSEKSAFLCKLWDGGEKQKFFHDVKSVFYHVTTVKPHASRTESSEIFILARNFVGFK